MLLANLREVRRAASAARTVELGPEGSLHVRIAGAGQDLVLLHGAITTHADWLDGPFEALARMGRAIAVDRPGHGLSRRPRFAGDPHLQAAQLREGLEAIGVKRPVLIGHSLGCLCAAAYAEMFPDNVSHLILVAPLIIPELRLFEHSIFAPRATPIFGPALSRMMPAELDRAILEAIHKIMFAPARPDDAWRRNYPWPQILDTKSAIANAEDLAAVHPLSVADHVNLGSIDAQAHIFSGSADLVVNHVRQATLIDAVLPNAVHIRLKGEGHMAHRSRPDAIIGAVRDVVSRLEGARC